MPIEGIISGLQEIAEKFELGMHSDYIKDAIDALADVDAELDKAYRAGKYDQLCEDFETIVGGMS